MITLRVKTNIEPFMGKMFKFLQRMPRLMRIKNRLVAKFSIRHVKTSMRKAGIQRRTRGGLFDQIIAVDVTEKGFGIAAPGLANVLEQGVRAHKIVPRGNWPLGLRKEGTIIYRRSVGAHSIRARPWTQIAMARIGKTLFRTYDIMIEKELGKLPDKAMVR